jgi:hypothetical protein
MPCDCEICQWEPTKPRRRLAAACAAAEEPPAREPEPLFHQVRYVNPAPRYEIRERERSPPPPPPQWSLNDVLPFVAIGLLLLVLLLILLGQQEPSYAPTQVYRAPVASCGCAPSAPSCGCGR